MLNLEENENKNKRLVMYLECLIGNPYEYVTIENFDKNSTHGFLRNSVKLQLHNMFLNQVVRFA